MTATELLIPRYEVIADYPNNERPIGAILQEEVHGYFYYRKGDIGYHANNKNIDNYPHLFRKLNWWENRKAEDMPKQVICKAIPNDTEIIDIEEWDMDILVGWINTEERTCCSLRSFNPEYGYFPVS